MIDRPPAIVDTNVVVSGLLSGSPQSPVCRILDGMLAGTFSYLLSPELLGEYRVVLMRTRIRKLHGLKPSEIDRILSEVVVNALWREPQASVAAPEPGDDHLWTLLAAQRGSVLVTGDRLLLENPLAFALLLSPRSSLELLES